MGNPGTVCLWSGKAEASREQTLSLLQHLKRLRLPLTVSVSRLSSVFESQSGLVSTDLDRLGGGRAIAERRRALLNSNSEHLD